MNSQSASGGAGGRWLRLLPLAVLVWGSLGQWGCQRARIPHFDGEHAFWYLTKQCQFGTREPGSPGHKETAVFLAQELRFLADLVDEQRFMHQPSESQSPIEMTNIIASFYPDMSRRALLATHWDTRPFADRDPHPGNRETPILGANDGASGTAVLLELAHCLKSRRPKVGVDIVLFDGEDSGREGHLEEYFIGSRYFAQTKTGRYRPEYGIVIDMIGDRDLQVYIEGNSWQRARWVVDKVWSEAERLRLGQFRREVRHWIADDHLSVNDMGVPCIVIIDFDYPHWHTVADTPDKCSVESLQAIGDLLLRLLYR